MKKGMPEHRTAKWVLSTVVVLLTAGILIGCAGSSKKTGVPPDESILRVGVSTNYPPLIFQQGEDIEGAEADLARELASYLGKEPVFVAIDWQDQLDKLVAGETDIIMAGMSVTEERLYFAELPRVVACENPLCRFRHRAAPSYGKRGGGVVAKLG